jgi:hypothetical protein
MPNTMTSHNTRHILIRKSKMKGKVYIKFLKNFRTYLRFIRGHETSVTNFAFETMTEL